MLVSTFVCVYLQWDYIQHTAGDSLCVILCVCVCVLTLLAAW